MSTKWWCRRWREWRGGDWRRRGRGCSTAGRCGASPASCRRRWTCRNPSNVRSGRWAPAEVRRARLLQPSHGFFGPRSRSASHAHPNLGVQLLRLLNLKEHMLSELWHNHARKVSFDHADVKWPHTSMPPTCTHEANTCGEKKEAISKSDSLNPLLCTITVNRQMRKLYLTVK